eukprot:TRINITY_DN28891_c0_g1_i1.p1 TRINITY_DN28891_c0_g1~~TRINITY_DN28891_c0_g1_i1.p1  ORF type:complete len:158 (-),score=50.54 TRINITY_DN28891_c0_g1_i1:82-555(-)
MCIRDSINAEYGILNDNDMSIAPAVGALSAYLAKIISSRPFLSLRDFGKKMIAMLPRPLADRARQAEEYARGMAAGGGTLFDELGFYYVGPIDGHNMEHLLPVLENVRDAIDGPILVHVVTEKGRGHPFEAVSYTHLRAHETVLDLVCRLLLEKKKR